MSALAIVVLSLGYGMLGLTVGCRIASLLAWRWMADDNRRRAGHSYHASLLHPDGEQWFGAACLGLLSALVWPLVVLGAVFRGVLFSPPRDIRIEQQEKRIAELERELEIVR
jgi:hypothetical protein